MNLEQGGLQRMGNTEPVSIDLWSGLRDKYEHVKRGHIRPLNENQKPSTIDEEIGGMTAYFAEKTWRKSRAWLDAHPDSVGAGRFINKTFAPVSYQELDELFAKNPVSAMEKLRKYSYDTLAAQMEELSESIRDSIEKSGEPQTRDEKGFVRYGELLAISARQGEMGIDDKPENHIWAGLDMATRTAWTIIEGLPEVFSQQYDRLPTTEEAVKLRNAGREFTLKLATLETETFFALLEEISSSTIEMYPHAKNLEILQRGNRYELSIKSDAAKKILDKVDQVLEHPREGLMRTGCPALTARGPDGKNLVVELYDWLSGLAERFYYPSLAMRHREG